MLFFFSLTRLRKAVSYSGQAQKTDLDDALWSASFAKEDAWGVLFYQRAKAGSLESGLSAGKMPQPTEEHNKHL